MNVWLGSVKVFEVSHLFDSTPMVYIHVDVTVLLYLGFKISIIQILLHSESYQDQIIWQNSLIMEPLTDMYTYKTWVSALLTWAKQQICQ